MEIEAAGRTRVCAPEFRVAAVTHGDVFQPAVDGEIDECGAAQDAVRDQIAAEPVENAR